jgi:hypothetical protein
MSKTKSIEEYFDRWPEYFGQKEGAIDVLIERSDGSQQWCPSNGCCGWMRFITKAKSITSVFASLWCRYEDLYDAACDYWNYLLGPDSPYRKALKGVERFYDKKGRPIAFGLNDPSAPLQLCMGVIIQCRVPQEQASKLRSYKWWRDNGFTQTQAFFLSEHIYMFSDGNIRFRPDNEYHHGFEPHTGIHPTGGICFKKLSTGTPDHTNQSWKNGDTYYDQIKKAYLIWTAPESQIYTLLKAQEKYAGNFKGAFKSTVSKELIFPGSGICSKEKAVEILKENLDKWAPNA